MEIQVPHQQNQRLHYQGITEPPIQFIPLIQLCRLVPTTSLVPPDTVELTAPQMTT